MFRIFLFPSKALAVGHANATFSRISEPIQLICTSLRRLKKRQEMAQSHHCDNSVHLKRTFVSLVRKLLSFCGLAFAGSKPRVFPTLNLVLRTER
jgi:hypothetical protein